MGARENILARIRAKLGKSGNASTQELAAARSYIEARIQGPRPSFAWTDLKAQFREQAEAMASTVDEVETLAEVPAALARYVNERQLDRKGACWPGLEQLDWPRAGIQMEARPVRDTDLLGLTGCFCAIAETGTLVLLSGASTPAATSLLPDTHVAIVDVARIVPGMEEAWNLIRHECNQPPRAVNFVSGPSRSGDIEMHIVLGVHGPYRVHIILVRHGEAAPRELIHTDWWTRKSD